jgi:hypothetical protein
VEISIEKIGLTFCILGTYQSKFIKSLWTIYKLKLVLCFKPLTCPCCKTGRMITILVFGANAPPSAFSTHLNTKQTNEK